MPVSTVEWKNNKLKIIDQTLLPHKVKFINCNSINSVWGAIKKMKIRGAPALGIAAGYGVYLGVKNSKKDTFFRDLERSIRYLAGARPTARNTFWALERMKKTAIEYKNKSIIIIKNMLLKEAHKIYEEDRSICRRIARYGSSLIKKGDRILTHCNTGALATADYGTALGIFYRAKSERKKIKVYIDETRPLLQGARLTAWELLREGIDAILICDNMAASLMAKGEIDKIIVGADRITKNGDVANKIGTYNLAVLAYHHRIPFYVASPVSTIDMGIFHGKEIPIEERDEDEVKRIANVYITPKKIKVYNPAFDVTPNRYITAIITEKGILKKPYKDSIRKVIKE